MYAVCGIAAQRGLLDCLHIINDNVHNLIDWGLSNTLKTSCLRYYQYSVLRDFRGIERKMR